MFTPPLVTAMVSFPLLTVAIVLTPNGDDRLQHLKPDKVVHARLESRNANDFARIENSGEIHPGVTLDSSEPFRLVPSLRPVDTNSAIADVNLGSKAPFSTKTKRRKVSYR
jgi:hypothetical protein